MDAIINLILDIYAWLSSGIYDFFVELVAWLHIKVMTIWFGALLWKMNFIWDVASSMMEQLSIAGEINSAFAGLPAASRELVYYAKIPEALNMILNAGITRFLMRFWL